MSEPKLISPLLAEHVMGAPISDHHGVRCCPAMRKDSDSKYIVKIISIPASQIQLDALLITGAYPSKEAALDYFRELSEAAVQEAELLQRLSRLEGFTAYEGWQVVPMEDGVGFDVYLLGAYRQTLERHFRRSPMTHLAAVNLGLDLCAALSVCRRSGYLYVDMKPENIFITENQEYRIGDLGFISLASLKYASLPEKYRSAYTAPEVTDAYSALNSTLDIYAAGLILYQAYNNGKLPAAEEPLAPPAYADYEMAQIILKACAANPEDRWQEPTEMGQALVSYMQRNGANDTPIVSISTSNTPAAADVSPAPEETAEAPEETAEAPEETAEAPEEVPAEESAEEVPSDSEPASEPAAEMSAGEEVPETLPLEAASADAPETVHPSEPDESDTEEAFSGETDSAVESPEPGPEEDPDEEQFVIDGFLLDETLPSEEITAEFSDTVLSDEVTEMLAQADELIAHEPPAPAVAPEPIDVPIPPRIVTVPEEPQGAAADEPEGISAEPDASEEPADDPQETPVAAEEVAIPDGKDAAPIKKGKNLNNLIAVLVTVLVLLLLAIGAVFFYQEYYLQPILDLSLDGDGSYLTVVLNTETDNSLLTVYCTDTYGNTLKQPVINNTAGFTDLHPGTTYTVSVKISGFHKLIGCTSKSYSTAAQTNIVSFTAVTGDQDGSVILNFSVQGPDNTIWRVKYAGEGQTEKTIECTGHMATITGLEIGTRYTFRLEPAAELYVVGSDTLEYTASNVIYPRNLRIEGFDSGALIAVWDVPEGANIGSWTVRCYNSGGYDSTFTVTEPKAVIEGLDTASAYTVDVQAEGMSVSERVSVSANSVTFKDILLDDSTKGQLVVTWNYEGAAPEDGWRLFYTVDGSDKQIVYCDKNTCTISPLVPGAHYSISFELPDNVTVFGGTAEYDARDYGTFDAYRASAEEMTFRMCRTWENAGWKWYNLNERDFSDKYRVGSKASFVVLLTGGYSQSDDEIDTLFVVKDAGGKLVSVNAGRTRSWSAMWSTYNGRTGTELDLPSMPQTAGSYTVDIYFAGAYVTTYAFTVTAE
ncbi:MAG: protein kinase [Oscillospiraceae bacterium]|nr:protein kinase [Oscillospiraceae bacterium]